MKGFLAALTLGSLAVLGHGGVCYSDMKCSLMGGQCVTQEASPDGMPVAMRCGKDFLFQRFCGASENCMCCTQENCEQTDVCARYGGRCAKKHECEPGHRFEPKMCACNPFLGEKHCGCCLPVKPLPTSSPTMRPSAHPTPSPTQCQLTEACAMVGGECTDLVSCPMENAFDATLCSIAGHCGCCYAKVTQPPAGSPTYTNPPSTMCGSTDQCMMLGGWCTYAEADFKCPEGYLTDRNACEGDMCACCRYTNPPSTSPPTSQSPSTYPSAQPPICGNSDQCSMLGGWCNYAQADFNCPAGYVTDRDMCEGDTCACCRPSDGGTAPPTGLDQCMHNEACAGVNGTCVPGATACPPERTYSPELCYDTATGDMTNCGCCH